MQNNIIRISNFQNRLNNLFTLTGFYFKSKVVKFSHKGKNMFFNCWVFLLKICISDIVKFFFRLVVILATQFFSGSTYLLDSCF